MSEVSAEKQVIRDTIRELIEKLKNYIIDLEQVRAVCKEQHGIETVENIDFEKRDIVNYKGKIAFKLDLKISFDLSILIDRKGNCISKLQKMSHKLRHCKNV
jgi:hypothetical protein